MSAGGPGRLSRICSDRTIEAGCRATDTSCIATIAAACAVGRTCLLRKAKGLEESLDRTVRTFGNEALELLETLVDAVYRAREGPHDDLKTLHAQRPDQFRAASQRMQQSSHDKARTLAVEFLNDWETIFIVLDHPHLPLTNNEAERALRHWVILRRIGYGTRTAVGSKSFALLASVIDTCRRRNASPRPYLARVIENERRELDAPRLPPVEPAPS
jgi:transposase